MKAQQKMESRGKCWSRLRNVESAWMTSKAKEGRMSSSTWRGKAKNEDVPPGRGVRSAHKGACGMTRSRGSST